MAPSSATQDNQHVFEIAASTRHSFVAFKSCTGETYADNEQKICNRCEIGYSREKNNGINIGKESCKICSKGTYRNAS